MNPYDNIESLGLETDFQSWPSHQSPVFKELIDELKPKNIIEVGSWKGVSAIVMAEASEEYGTHIHCVDTWLGDFLHHNGTDKLPRDQWGYPQLYHQFLTNVKARGHQDRITPYPMCSVDGARTLAKKGITAQLILIDAGHDMESCYWDERMFWGLLDSGGAMIVDDIFVFPEVMAATMRFCCEARVDLVRKDPFALLRKK